MAENRKQHYVPQFYLRFFSQDGIHICVYNTERKNSYLTLIRTSCCENYFYSKNPDIEKILSEIESKQSQILKKIIDEGTISNLSEDETDYLRLFVLMQLVRTKEAKENFFGKIVDFFSKSYVLPKIKSELLSQGYEEKDVDLLELRSPDLHIHGILQTLNSDVILISDLKALILINNARLPFITSDAPVILNNYLKVKSLSLVGLQSQGLQIILPINPNLSLMLIDSRCYNVPEENNGIVNLTKESDVSKLNLLQILNCNENIFYHHRDFGDYIKSIHEQVQDRKRTKEIRETLIRTDQKEDGTKSEIVMVNFGNRNFEMKFQFLKLNHAFNRIFKSKMKKLQKTGEPFVPIRDRKLIEIAEKKSKKRSKP